MSQKISLQCIKWILEIDSNTDTTRKEVVRKKYPKQRIFMNDYVSKYKMITVIVEFDIIMQTNSNKWFYC